MIFVLKGQKKRMTHKSGHGNCQFGSIEYTKYQYQASKTYEKNETMGKKIVIECGFNMCERERERECIRARQVKEKRTEIELTTNGA